MLVVFFGMTAAGKSTLAAYCAKRWQAPHYNTDRVRKELAGLLATERRADGLGQGIYTREFSARTYTTLLAQAAHDIQRGLPLVLLDGSYLAFKAREEVRQKAAALKTSVFFVHCFCSEKETLRRLAQRAQDPNAVSDGRLEIYHYQRLHYVAPLASEADILNCNTEEKREIIIIDLEKRLALSPPAQSV